MTKKYKRLRAEYIPNPFIEGEMVKVQRIIALRDIPLHGVKKGDTGGFLAKQAGTNLSQSDDCWVGGNAVVLGSINIEDNAIITDEAVIHGGSRVEAAGGKGYYNCGVCLVGNASVSGNVRIDYLSVASAKGMAGYIGGSSQIKDNAHLINVREINGQVKISGRAIVNNAVTLSGILAISDDVVIGERTTIRERAQITGNANIGAHCTISGASKIGGNTKVPEFSEIKNGKEVKRYDISGADLVEYKGAEEDKTSSKKFWKRSQETSSDPDAENDARWDAYVEKYHEIKDIITGYSSDIIQIIKYPVMTDLTDPHTADLMFALKKADLEMAIPNSKEFIPVVENLEKKCLVAESNARRIAASMLSEASVKKTEQAKDLFAVALNEISSDHEKRQAFKQGFKRLEGVVAIPDEAIRAMKIKIGIPELEM